MRTFSKGRLARATAYLLSSVFLWSMVLMGGAVTPAAAQIVTKAATANTQSVIVVPFVNRTKLHVGMLGDEAADAVAAELRDRLLLDVYPKADVARQMRDLGMTPPLTDSEMVRMATELDAPLTVAGEVRGARIVPTRDGHYAEVVLAVRLFDRVARADMNGAVVSAVSPTSMDMSDDELLQKALQQAAFTAVQQMKSRPSVSALVLWTREDTVFLNVGTRGGIRPGMKLVAIRNGERIGLAKVTEADAIGSYATSVEGSPLRTGDTLRAVYDMPSGTKPERVGEAQAKRHRFETLAMAGAVLFGFGSYANRTRRLDEGDTAAPGFKAANISNGADFGISGYLPSMNPVRDLQPRPSAILTWDRYKGTEKSRLIAFIIQRNAEIVNVLVQQGGGDTQQIDTGTNAPSFISLDLAIDTVTGELTLVDEITTLWDPQDFDPLTGTFSNPTFDEFVADNEADAGISFTLPDSVHIGWFPSIPPGDDIGGMAAGTAYQYTITPLLVTQDRLAAWSLGSGEPTRSRNIVVGVAPAGLFPTHFVFRGLVQGVYEVFDQLPNPEISGNRATFFFYYPFGADEITLQIARDPNFEFTPPNVLNVGVPAIGPDLTIFGGQQSSVQVDLSQVPGSGSLFFWRIAARSFFDTHPPRSIPIDEPSLRGFVYSVTEAFLPSTSATRAAMMHEQRQALEALRAARARLPRTATTDRIHRAD